MIDLNQIYLDIQSILESEATVGVPVIEAEQNAPRPTTDPYITIKLLLPNQVGGIDRTQFDEVTGIETVESINQLDIIISGYGAGSHQELHNLRFKLNKNTVCDSFLSKNIAIRDVSELTDTTILLDTDWEQRGSFVISTYVIHSEDDTVGTIETVEVDTSVCDADESIVNNDKITIS